MNDLLIPTSDIKPTRIAKCMMTKVFSTAWINMYYCFSSHNLSVFPEEVMPSVTYSYIQLLLWVKASRLLIIYCGQFQTYTTHENDNVPITQLQYSVFFFFFFVIHVFYLFLKVLLESSWMISLLQLVLCISTLPSFVG